MDEKYLIINAGSSSLKFSLYAMPGNEKIVNGYVEKIGYDDSFYTLKFDGKKVKKEQLISNHNEAVQIMLNELLGNGFISNLSDIKGIGHRVVHGAEKYSDSVLITDEVISDIVANTKYAPLHHPGNLAGIRAMKEVLPEVPQVAVFDTAFHQTIPSENYLYGVPYEWYLENGVRKYGFHGTSHKYITETMQKNLGKQDVNLVICHIGSGASLCCVKDGKSIDTTMGLTPQDGILMGTRCGTIDSSIIGYICKERNLSVETVMDILNKQSGLLGLTGKNDYRDLDEMAKAGNERAKLALKMLQKSIIRSIAYYCTELEGNVDAIVFTAGIGENSTSLRANIINTLSTVLNVKLDEQANSMISINKEKQSGIISTDDSGIGVYVIPTDEEYMILKDTYEISKQQTNDIHKSIVKGL